MNSVGVERRPFPAPHWIGAPGGAVDPTGTERLIAIDLAALPAPWRLGEPFPGRVDFTATLDVRRGTWRLR
ncbi:hypothetical protein ACIQWR_18005 [Streptomyces sp. NPDC098789]|uniref:hypothetical protein n=1 Tax=Streptomyces sp. NPDC098789 TaxID=3366098 RepID=UPI0037FDA772